MKLPEKQAKIIKFLKEWEGSGKKYSPSYQEIADGAGLSSTSVVQIHLGHLRTAGLVTYEDNIFRTVRLAEPVGG